MKKAHHAPTIGILLCENKNEIVAEYSLDGVDEPIGISQYELGAALTQHLKSSGLNSPSLNSHNLSSPGCASSVEIKTHTTEGVVAQ